MKINKTNGYIENSKRFFNEMVNKKQGDSHMHYESAKNYLKERKFRNLLDVGCGVGNFLIELKESFKNEKIEYYGIDLAEKMIEAGREKDPTLILSVGNSEELEFENEKFDTLVCINSFHHYPNPSQATKEIGRVLKHGGRLILGEIYIVSPLREIINLLLPYGNTGDYKIYSNKEVENLMKRENLNLIKKKYIFPSNYIYLFEKN